MDLRSRVLTAFMTARRVIPAFPIFALAFSLAACGSAQPPPAAPAHASAASLDGMFEVHDGLAMHLHCIGSGSPTVVLDAGFGVSGTGWQHTQRAMAENTRVCAYDRLGAGHSDPAPRPHTFAQLTSELRTLLAKAGVDGPYVLVAHSIAGLIARLYAVEHPGDVAGVVLVDASSEYQDAMWKLLPPEAANMFEDRDSREGFTFATVQDGMARLRAANRSLGDKPLVVLTAGRMDGPPDMPPETEKKLADLWRELQAAYERLSTNSAHVIAPKSGHFMESDEPRLVIAAVRQAVEAARTHGRVNAAALEAVVRK